MFVMKKNEGFRCEVNGCFSYRISTPKPDTLDYAGPKGQEPVFGGPIEYHEIISSSFSF